MFPRRSISRRKQTVSGETDIEEKIAKQRAQHDIEAQRDFLMMLMTLLVLIITMIVVFVKTSHV